MILNSNEALLARVGRRYYRTLTNVQNGLSVLPHVMNLEAERCQRLYMPA